MKEQRKLGRIVTRSLIATGVFIGLNGSQSPTEHQFDLLRYQAENLPLKIWELFNQSTINEVEGTEIVKRYFSSDPRDLTLENQTEAILAKQITNILKDEGISVFPSVLADLTEIPKTLVTSPREKIEIKKQVPLESEISLVQMERIEEKEESRNPQLSALVVENGGWAITYPTTVVRHKNLEEAIEAIVHEWAHQYLTFKPLGFLYLMDLADFRKNYEIANLNEVVATIVGREIAQRVIEMYYPPNEKKVETRRALTTQSFDFNQAVWEIGRVVDGYLKQGQVEEAERFMESARQNLASRGYPLRKLNTAYLASRGVYPTSLGDRDRASSKTSINLDNSTRDLISVLLEKKTSVEEMVKRLREKSVSLKDFLDKVSWLTSHEDLKELIQWPPTSVVIFER
ncbi:MAG: hypothetical protein Q8P89_03235 [bacterium]|nr:hypothetical protein [bacterium]